MNDEVKEILIGFVEYYNAIGTEDDPGMTVFENLAVRASKALERYAAEHKKGVSHRSSDVDPFGITAEFPSYKLEDEW